MWVGVMIHTFNASYLGGEGRRIMIQGQPWGKSMRLYPKITKAKRAGVGGGSSDRTPA
jgi:hypothetical protein